MKFTAEQHIDRRRIWQEKYAIRACYRGWFERMRPFIVPGPSMEVGAGAGDFKSYWPELITSDVVQTPFIDVTADAIRLPVANESLANVVVIDLLHHLGTPHEFLQEAARALRPGGRVLAIEPYITFGSYLGYRLFHHENVSFAGYQESIAKVDPWEGNLAAANLFFGRDLRRWDELHPELRIIRRQKFGLLDFQVACGFKPYALIKRPRLYDAALVLDRCIDGLAWLWGFRIFCVIEKVRLR